MIATVTNQQIEAATRNPWSVVGSTLGIRKWNSLRAPLDLEKHPISFRNSADNILRFCADSVWTHFRDKNVRYRFVIDFASQKA